MLCPFEPKLKNWTKRYSIVRLLEKPTGMEMEKKLLQFRDYLKRHHRLNSIEFYCTIVKVLNDWLNIRNMTIETSDESSLRDWARSNVKNRNYAYSVLAYCKCFELENQEKIMAQILKEMPRDIKESHTLLIKSPEFKRYFLIEKKCKNQKHLAFINLLWSEMELNEIMGLRKSDLHFFKYISVNDKKYYVTQDAWEALEKYVRIEDRGKNEKLFTIKERSYQLIIQKYFGEHELKARDIRRSCEEEINNYGRMAVFVTPDQPHFLEKLWSEKSESELIQPEFFDRVIQEIFTFGIRMASRIREIKTEEALQRLLEGYLIARLPAENILSEFSFQGYKDNSRVDFVIGKEQFPLEVKLCVQQSIGDCIRDGSAQVQEFLRFQKSAKGIVVIGDTHRNPKSRKHNGLHENVYIVVI